MNNGEWTYREEQFKAFCEKEFGLTYININDEIKRMIRATYIEGWIAHTDYVYGRDNL